MCGGTVGEDRVDPAHIVNHVAIAIERAPLLFAVMPRS